MEGEVGPLVHSTVKAYSTSLLTFGTCRLTSPSVTGRGKGWWYGLLVESFEWLTTAKFSSTSSAPKTSTSKVKIFLAPAEAVAALRAKNRSVGALTYGWGSPDHPDVTNDYLHSVRRFLLCPLGTHICAVFWDCPSLRQKPRTSMEDQQFKEALSIMGDVYASALGTTVMQHRTVLPRPLSLDGE